jgi:hypothetical protein
MSVAASKGGTISPARLGYWLRDNQDRQLGGRKLVRAGKAHGNKVLWAVLDANQRKDNENSNIGEHG